MDPVVEAESMTEHLGLGQGLAASDHRELAVVPAQPVYDVVDGAQQDRFAQRCQTLDGCGAKPGITKVPGAVGSSQWRPHLLSESATRGLVYLSGKLRSGSLWSPDTPYAIYYERTRA